MWLDENINAVIKPFIVKKDFERFDNQEYYASSNTVRCIELAPGTKILYRDKEKYMEISEELTNKNINNRVGYNPDSELWSIAIIE